MLPSIIHPLLCGATMAKSGPAIRRFRPDRMQPQQHTTGELDHPPPWQNSDSPRDLARTGVPGYLRRTGPMSSLKPRTTIGVRARTRESGRGQGKWCQLGNLQCQVNGKQILLSEFPMPQSTFDLGGREQEQSPDAVLWDPALPIEALRWPSPGPKQKLGLQPKKVAPGMLKFLGLFHPTLASRKTPTLSTTQSTTASS